VADSGAHAREHVLLRHDAGRSTVGLEVVAGEAAVLAVAQERPTGAGERGVASYVIRICSGVDDEPYLLIGDALNGCEHLVRHVGRTAVDQHHTHPADVRDDICAAARQHVHVRPNLKGFYGTCCCRPWRRLRAGTFDVPATAHNEDHDDPAGERDLGMWHTSVHGRILFTGCPSRAGDISVCGVDITVNDDSASRHFPM